MYITKEVLNLFTAKSTAVKFKEVKNMFEEQPIRTFVKTISWRLIAVSLTILAFYLYTGNLSSSLWVGISVNVVKMGFYYMHERMWNQVQFGRVEKKMPEYSI